MEVLLSGFPQSESAKHIGAWSPWAATGLIIAAALISKAPHNPIRKMSSFSFQALQRIGGCLGSGVMTVRNLVSRRKKLKQLHPAPIELKTLGPVGQAKSDHLSALFKNLKRTLASCGNTVTDEWRSLVGFWRDPDNMETAIA